MSAQTELEMESKAAPSAIVVTLDAPTGGDSSRRSERTANKLRIMQEIPKPIRNQHMCVKFVYLCVYGLLFWLLYSLPSDMLWDKDGNVQEEYMSLLLFAICVSYGALVLVQGSNPGYVEIGGDGEDADRSVEMSSLLHSDAQDNASQDGEDERKPIPVSSGLIPEHASAGSNNRQLAAADESKTEARRPAGASKITSVAPLRSKFCRTCQARVCTYDHHCFVIGTCIGERNHCRFWWLLLTTTITICISIGVVDNGYVYERYWWDWIAANQLAFLATLIFYFLLLVIGGLFLFHTWLACSSLTTYEMGKGPDTLPYLEGTRDFDLPFSNGLIGNLQSFCCVRDGVWGMCGRKWRPIRWKPPGRIDRESEDVFENCWENAYWSCC